MVVVESLAGIGVEANVTSKLFHGTEATTLYQFVFVFRDL